MLKNQHNQLKQQNLASAIRARPVPADMPGEPAEQMDMMKAIAVPPDMLNPMTALTKKWGIGGKNGIQTPEGYIYDAISGMF